jgi:hypothetical protein
LHLFQHQLHHTLGQLLVHQRIQRWQAGELGHNSLESTPAFCGQVLAAAWVLLQSNKRQQHTCTGQGQSHDCE